MEQVIELIKALTGLGSVIVLGMVARGFLPLSRDQAPSLIRPPDREWLPPPAPPSTRLPRRPKTRRRLSRPRDHGE